jgi:two-component system phosphate regulon response regulator PhoB
MSKALKERILVIEDEPDLLELIEVNLKAAGFDIVSETTGTAGLNTARKSIPALIVLDVMLPELDGLEICKMLRRDTATAAIPILMLTARASELDRVLGLELGADDYVTKPFSTRELVLRVKNLLKRKNAVPSGESTEIQFGELSIDRARHRVCFQGRPLELTLTEFKLVTLLAERQGRVQSRDQLLRDVWGYNSLIDTRTVDTHMRRLRHKLGGAARYLDTVRGVGYRFLELQN